ncbi:MAG: polysaccharide export protein EpsE [Betaproteobacteria bacterium HGW-Betaproteobacteria-1]|jgi:polysaccharide export outer membrane protein|nr:MAG: polysaccharide export protein EpsE [Betaproteobacteria bacterium HGW-Betaproteobacteria-1]
MKKHLERLIKACLLICTLVGTLAFVPPLQAASSDYQLGAGDLIRISVFQNADLELETRISEDGSINYPLIGTVELAGLSTGAAEQLIAEKLSSGGFVKRPQVNINVVDARSSQVSVIGMVNEPGRYALESGRMRLTAVMTLAGGLMPEASDIVIVTGQRDGKPFRQEVDLPALFLDEGSENNIFITAGDEIFAQRAPVFYIYGEAQKPGSYRVERNMSVIQALAQGGGPTVRGTQRNIKLLRRNAEGVTEELKPKLTDLIRADDVIFVSESLF